MEDFFGLARLCCFAFGVMGIVLSFAELTKYLFAINKFRNPHEHDLISRHTYRKMATYHRDEFLSIFIISNTLIIVSFLTIR